MNTKLIQTKDYLLLIDEEVEIKGTPCLCYNSIKNTWSDDVILYQDSMPEYHYKGFQKIIAYYPLTKDAQELDLPLLPNPFKGEGIERLALKWFVGCNKKDIIFDLGWMKIFEAGYKAAQSDKQFSLEDVENILIRYLEEGFISKEQGYINPNSFLKSLSTQQLPKEFIPTIEYYISWKAEWTEIYQSDDDKITRLKITTNSEDREVVQGIYNY